MELIFAQQVSKLFTDKVKDIAGNLPAADPNWLMFLMGFETGWTFSPSIKNPNSSATGLIQFLESTANDLGTTTAQLKLMSAEDQLDYVYKYLKQKGKKFGSYHDLYLAIIYPAAIGQPDTYELDSVSSMSNLGFDVNKDKKVTVGEIKQSLDAKVKQIVSADYWPLFFSKKNFFQLYKREIIFWAILIVLMIGVILMIKYLSK